MCIGELSTVNFQVGLSGKGGGDDPETFFYSEAVRGQHNTSCMLLPRLLFFSLEVYTLFKKKPNQQSGSRGRSVQEVCVVTKRTEEHFRGRLIGHVHVLKQWRWQSLANCYAWLVGWLALKGWEIQKL